MSVDVMVLQKKLREYLEFYVECFFSSDEDVIMTRIFNVPAHLFDETEEKVFDFERQNPEYKCLLMPLVKTESVTAEYYPEVLEKIKNESMNELLQKLLEPEQYACINEVNSDFIRDEAPVSAIIDSCFSKLREEEYNKPLACPVGDEHDIFLKVA